MFIDASAIVAILNREPDSDQIVHRIGDHKGQRFVSALVRFETVAAVARSRSGAQRPTPEQFEAAEKIVAAFCDSIDAKDISITGAVGTRAMLAARTYGKMVGHKADLNFGDCFAYACASTYSARLVYKGDDFAKTDLA